MVRLVVTLVTVHVVYEDSFLREQHLSPLPLSPSGMSFPICIASRRVENKYDSNKSKTRMLDPHPTPPLVQTTLINTLQQALESPGLKDNKDECILDLTGPEKDYWNDTEAGKLKDYRFPDTYTSGDGSNHEDTKTMGSGFWTLKELHWVRSVHGQERPPQPRPKSTTRVQILSRGGKRERGRNL